MGGKKKKRKVKSKETKAQHNPAANPLPQKNWFSQMLDANKIIAGGTVIAAILVAIGIAVNDIQYHQDHRPRVVFSRFPTMSEFSCTVDGPQVNGREGAAQQWIKNIGNVEAQDVYPYSVNEELIPDRRTGNALFDSPPTANDGTCQMHVNPSVPVFQLSPGEEVVPQMPQGVLAERGLSLKSDDLVQLFQTKCVFYFDSSDWSWNAHHSTCVTYRFQPDTGQASFRCDGNPVRGTFIMHLSGHCAN